MNITEFLTELQARHDEAVARTDELRGHIEDLTARSSRPKHVSRELTTARKVIAELAPTGDGDELDPPEKALGSARR